MWAVRIGKIAEYLTGRGLLFGLLWAGLICLSLGLAALLLTRWGQSRPLRKCLVLSLLAHLLFAIYSTTVEIFVGAMVPAEEAGVPVHLVGDPTPAQTPSEATGVGATPIWEQLLAEKTPLLAESPDRQPSSVPEVQRSPYQQSLPSELSVPLAQLHLETSASVPLGDASPPTIRPEHAPEVPVRPRPPEPVEVAGPMRKEAMERPPALDLPLGRSFSQTGIVHPDRLPVAGAPPGLVEIPLPADSNPQPPFGASAGNTTSPPQAIPQIEVIRADSASPGMASAWLAPADAKHGPAFGASVAPGFASPLVGPSQLSRANPLLNPPAPPAPGELPKLYQARTAPDRQQWAVQHGATEQTERAVQAALAWLAANQEPDGRWDAARHGAGRELFVGGRNRQGSGAQAHTATTGLALLAFLARGATHQQGQYQKTVAQALEYLLRSQAPDGNLAGPADFYAFMYCHGIATLALSEAYAMTQDARLREPLRQAITYTLAAQHPEQGGWRYRPREPGDTSQLGWQLMALKSAELAGLPIPEATKQGAWRFLQTVSSGPHRGLAAYRALETPSPAMTAEALLCRLFLGQPPSDPACQEAGQYLLQHLPGQSEPNLYYWYYGTLAMFQMGGHYWKTWNDALQKTLLPRQHTTGPLAGSWDPDTRWDNYGGRVYSTALSALCLEVYYRYLPLYVHVGDSQLAQPKSPNR
ncbi:MAG: hypothetical protein NZ602_02920 [Thermoguttaceae bacterium]|nr:hypothetical protein [Thermoguttaceae bacterium]MDW8039123.1 hypothetical protein [Thermoguttaceae bacterium]